MGLSNPEQQTCGGVAVPTGRSESGDRAPRLSWQGRCATWVLMAPVKRRGISRLFSRPSIRPGVARAVAIAATLLAVELAVSRGLPAQDVADEQESRDVARELAQRALDSLQRGEEAATADAKLAAYRDGLDLARHAIEADDTNADAHFATFANTARIMEIEGVAAHPLAFLKMTRELDRTLELNPNHVDALTAKGRVYRQLPWLLGGSLEKAAKYLARAVELDPDAVGVRIELAKTYRDMGHPERGVPLLERAAEIAARRGDDRQLAEIRGLLTQLISTR